MQFESFLDLEQRFKLLATHIPNIRLSSSEKEFSTYRVGQYFWFARYVAFQKATWLNYKILLPLSLVEISIDILQPS